MRAQNTKMQLSFCAVFVASVCVKLASPVDGQAYGNGHVGKKGTSSSAIHADNDRNGEPPQSCSKEADYEISQNYIIRTKDSKANGANFIVALTVRTFDVCLEQCCLKENCDTTIFVGEAYRSEDTNCFLFECRPEGKGTENRCLFTYHLGYISSMKKALGGFQGFPPDPEPVTTVRQIEETTTKPTPPPKLVPIEPVSNCHSGYFECDSGQCINDLYICNSVVDCDDGSDEYRCSPPQDPLPEDQTGPDEEMQTDAPYPINKDVAQQEAVTVMALPQDAVTDGKAEGTGKAKDAGKAEDAGKGNDTKQLTAESNENTDEMVYESRGGSGMPPASSAILPLVIGLVITVVLLLMVGCRLRYMNQRLRYGRLKTSAHDADYLINGMYL